MAHDKGGLGITVGILMQGFDPGHLAAFLGAFESVDQNHRAAVAAYPAPPQEVTDREQPSGGEWFQWQGRRMETVEQAIVTAIGQAQTANQTGHAGQVGAEAKGGQDDG
jgi:hypothetical protein